MSYAYVPLQDANSIRLLQLEPGYGRDPLEVHLATHQLGKQCSYHALSYVWGEPDLTETLCVGDQRLYVSKNLYSILLQLRLPEEIRTLWIDAICINQQDSIEKGQQVALMGEIYHQAETVLCWLGQLSTHRLWAMKFLQKLAEDAPEYTKQEDIGPFWTVTSTDHLLLPNVDASLIVDTALEAHVEAIYESDWFTRLWIVQELALARRAQLLFGHFILSWDEFETATRIIMACLFRVPRPPETLISIQKGWDLIHLRAKHSLHMRSITADQVFIEVDHPWSIGRVAWDMRHRNCKDDRDRVYALLSLAVSGNGLQIWKPETFVPDYTQPVEWVYHQYWRRYGGCTSLFYAGLSRRRGYSEISGNQATIQDVSRWFSKEHLPSWVPELRSHHTKEWRPIFGSDYGTSIPLQHQVRHFTTGPAILMIRGHRFDVVVRVLGLNQFTKPNKNIEEFVDLRAMIKSFMSLKSNYEPYPSGQAWTEALGFTLMMDVPYNHDHPFQKYLDNSHFKTKLSNSELRRIWKLYRDLLLSESGAVWKKIRAFASLAVNSQRALQFQPSAALARDGQIVWLLHNYIGDVLQAHRLFITERGYMGLAPPDAMAGDVVVAFGGPSVPFIVRDVTSVVMDEVAANTVHCSLGSTGSGRNLSQLLGPCYLQGIMKAELMEEKRYQNEFEWEKTGISRMPKPTLHLI